MGAPAPAGAAQSVARGTCDTVRLDLDTDAPTPRVRGRSPSLAALLSFLWPGLGQLYTGKRRLAALFAVPALLVLVLLAYELRQGPVVFLARFADPAFSRAAAVVVVLLGSWQVAAVVHAFVSGERRRTRRILDTVVLAALAVVMRRRYTPFADEFLLDLARVGRIVEFPFSPRVAQLCRLEWGARHPRVKKKTKTYNEAALRALRHAKFSYRVVLVSSRRLKRTGTIKREASYATS